MANEGRGRFYARLLIILLVACNIWVLFYQQEVSVVSPSPSLSQRPSEKDFISTINHTERLKSFGQIISDKSHSDKFTSHNLSNDISINTKDSHNHSYNNSHDHKLSEGVHSHDIHSPSNLASNSQSQNHILNNNNKYVNSSLNTKSYANTDTKSRNHTYSTSYETANHNGNNKSEIKDSDKRTNKVILISEEVVSNDTHIKGVQDNASQDEMNRAIEHSSVSVQNETVHTQDSNILVSQHDQRTDDVSTTSTSEEPELVKEECQHNNFTARRPSPDGQCMHKYKKEETSTKLIVFWTLFWHKRERWKAYIEHYGQLQKGCPQWRCEMIWTMSETERRLEEADAIVFYGLDVFSRPLPRRHAHQLWIWLEPEAPPIGQYSIVGGDALERQGIFFNMTMSYHSLSDITVVEAYFQPWHEPMRYPVDVTHTLNQSTLAFRSYADHMKIYDDLVKAEGDYLDQWILTQASLAYNNQGGESTSVMKTKDVDTESKGDMFISKTDDLNDVLGDQTTNKSFLGYESQRKSKEEKMIYRKRNGMTEEESLKFEFTYEEIQLASRPKIAAWLVSHCDTDSKRERIVEGLQKFMNVTIVGICGQLKCGKDFLDEYCYRWLSGSHLFYFSFENALCDEYKSEKLWRPMMFNLVPVVYGGANYNDVLPFGSYIDVSHFTKIKALADHLLFLANHPAAYLRHFHWKKFWQLKWPVPWCNLCFQVHKPNRIPAVTSLDSWWNYTSQCYDPLF